MAKNYVNFLISLYFSLFINLLVKAQINSISGNLIDNNKEPLAYINALVYNSNADYIGLGALSDDSGFFLIKDIPNGTYTIKFSALGFEEKTIENIIISTSNLQIELGAVTLLESSYKLESVDLIASKAILEREIDRAVLNVSNIISASGGTALDVLESTPGISVDREDLTVSMLGKNGLNIMINGRMNYLPNNAIGAFLSGINADNVEKIELITTPPANFDAQGNAGYINIILKKNLDVGYNLSGSISNGYDWGPSGNYSFNLNYVGEKYKFFTNYSYTFRDSRARGSIYRSINTKSYSEVKNFEIFRDPNRNVNNLIFGIERDFSDIITTGINLTFFKNDFDNKETRQIYTDLSQDFDVQDRFNSSVWENFQISTFSTFQKNENLKIQIGIDYLKYNNEEPNSFNNTLNYRLETPLSQSIDVLKKSPFNIFFTYVDFKKKYGNNYKLDYGFKMVDSEFDNQQRVVKNEVVQDLFTNSTNLDETNYMSYVSSEGKINNILSFKAGLRYEYTSSIVQDENLILVDRRYGLFFPTIYIGIKINDSNNINLNYGKRINRPSFKDMAPFFFYLDENSALTGNPELQPSFSNIFMVEYRFKSFFLQTSYDVTNDFISKFQTTYNEENGLALTQPTNFDSRELINFQLSLPINIYYWWSFRPDLSFKMTTVNESQQNENIKLKRNSYRITLAQQFKIKSKTTIETFLFYNGRNINGLRQVDPRGSFNLSARHKLSDKWTLTLNATNIFDTLENRWVTETSNLYQDLRYDNSNGKINLAVTFNFGKSDLKIIKFKNSEASSRL